MILKFPDLTTLRLALTSGVVPAAVGAAPATAGVDESGIVWVETAASLSRTAQRELRNLGVETARAIAADIVTEVSCWAELLPLQPDPSFPETTNLTPVLFRLSDGTALAGLVSEMLRLGNDRQGFRWLEDGKGQAKALLRVVGPPYYSLLRAVDRIGKHGAPVAFVERAPRVWVELGHTHPFAEHLKPPEGKLLLLRAPRLWTLLDDAPFRDVYEVLEFGLPASPSPLSDAEPGRRIRVVPTLKAGGTVEGAELWVLREGGVEELNRFVQNSDDRILNRLAFAVGEAGGRTTVVVRVRQSRQAAPVLVLNAEPYKQYLKLSNLFVPAGMRLHPPLRRDVVRNLLADDADRVTWLAPRPDGTFTPESLPENAFRPLSDWVDYVLDHESQALQAWVQAAQFDFEGFVCADDQPAKPRKGPDEDRRRGGKDRGEGTGDLGTEEPAAFARAPKTRTGTVPEPEADPYAALVPAQPTEVEKRRRAMEEKFVAADGGLDNPERTALWPELAALNAALGNSEDSAICWMNVLWPDNDAPLPPAWAWFCVEASNVRAQPASGRAWTSRLTLSGSKGREVTGEELDHLLALTEPLGADLRALAAYLVYAAGRPQPPQELMRRLNRVQRFLEAHERMLPVRAVWLAWFHLTRLAGNDVLGLARARDRLLARLYSNGLRPEQDLPTFLRYASEAGSLRFRAVRQWLTQLCERARQWAGRQGHDALYAGKNPRTAEYIDLLFAFGLARLNEVDASRRLLQRASAVLSLEDDSHQILLAGFRYRVEQALAGRPHSGPLPAEQHEYLELLSKGKKENHGVEARYIVDRMRKVSRVLEPDQQINPYRHYTSRTDGDLTRELALLPDVIDGKEVEARVLQLLRKPPKGASGQRAQIVRAGLDQAARVGEEFGRQLLDEVVRVYDALGKNDQTAATIAQAELLEKALFVAAHFDRSDQIPPLVTRFERLVEAQAGGATMSDEEGVAVEALVAQCFRGLRKLGMRDEVDRLLTLMAGVILQGQPLSSLNARPDKAAALRALLHVAGGWYYFGRESRAEPVLQTARTALLGGEWAAKGRDHTSLACAYAMTVGQAPVEYARRRLDELFEKLTDVRDTFTTNSYYSQSQIRVVEAVVLAVASDDFTLGSQARRWLDDDEFLVRRRIHRDVRELMAK
jgi:hypothetical protein